MEWALTEPDGAAGADPRPEALGRVLGDTPRPLQEGTEFGPNLPLTEWAENKTRGPGCGYLWSHGPALSDFKPGSW